MSLMGSLWTGVSGLQTSNNALNTTAHNMSNLDTVGYTRQQVAQSTRTYTTIEKGNKTNWKQIGLGVNYSLTRQERSIFLDKNYRRESGRSAFYDVSTSAMEEIEYILGEGQAGGSIEGHEFSESLSNFWVAVQELSKDPTSSVNQNLFVTRAYEFVTRASAVYKSLAEYQDNLNKSVVKEVDNINKYAVQIEELNKKIVSIEAGQEHANDLRDKRNLLLDKLAQLGNISYTEDITGYVSVRFEDVDLVKGGLINEMAIYTDPKTGFYTPYWTMLANFDYDKDGKQIVTQEGISGAIVFDLTREVSSDLNTDIGSLKGMLLARGDHRATYKELKNFPPDADPTDPEQAVDGWYDQNISQSIVMNIQAEFDQLINAVATKINDILAEEAESAGPAGVSDYLRDENGEPYKLFIKNTEGEDWTVSNLLVNPDLRQTPALLKFRKDEHSEDYPAMVKLKAAFEEKIYTLNPNVETPLCFTDYYKNLVAQVANSGSVFRGIQATQTQATDELLNAREQVVGVSSDEELTNMIRFQNAYNASSRYINVISEMLEHILSTLGR
ncbi:MAG: flagellar hook-associated protein FlgK [Lachnospiraceae bacterium]|nr:flagellar hook-associated protein FlgK [Lachnospiraceae bacterium]